MGKIAYTVISTVIMVVLVGLVVLLVGFKFIGFTPYAVLSGSMEPLYKVGSVVYVKDVEVDDVKVDDVITFYMENSSTVVTHQVKAIDAQNRLYYTKGLANETQDATPVTFDRIIGKVNFSIPYLGYISNYVTSPPGLYIIIGVVVIWLIVMFIVDSSKKDKMPEKE